MLHGIRKTSMDAVALDAISPVVARAAQSIGLLVAKMVAAQVEAEVRKAEGPKRGRPASRRRARGEITRWVADNRARRVPTFVIESTGLDTKKKIVAKYGVNAMFVKGKPLPAAKADGVGSSQPKSARVVKAKPPIVRKRGTAAA